MFIIVFPGLELNVLHSQCLWPVIGDWASLPSLYLRPRLGSALRWVGHLDVLGSGRATDGKRTGHWGHGEKGEVDPGDMERR